MRDSFDQITRAIEFATIAHDRKYRNGTEIPYIVHPFEVAMILNDNDVQNKNVLIAGILHDAMDDTTLNSDDIESYFSNDVVRMIKDVSVEMELSDMSTEVKLIVCADHLSNIRSLMRTYEIIGERLWNRFEIGYDGQKAHYKTLLRDLSSLKTMKMYDELSHKVNILFSK